MPRPLTPAEEQVLNLAARGYSARDIAYQSGAEEHTVRNAVRRICYHLGAVSLDHAVQIHRTPPAPDEPNHTPDQTPAQIAYTAYGHATGGLNHLSLPMPAWDDLSASIQAAWTAAATAALGQAVVIEIPRFGWLPLQLRRFHDADRWAICDRTGRRWGRDGKWMYEPTREELCDSSRWPLAEALPLAQQLAAAPINPPLCLPCQRGECEDCMAVDHPTQPGLYGCICNQPGPGGCPRPSRAVAEDAS